MENITKTFSGVKALDNVSFELRPGEVHGRHFRGGQAEEVEILFAHGLADFDVGPIQGADGQRPVEREFHGGGDVPGHLAAAGTGVPGGGPGVEQLDLVLAFPGGGGIGQDRFDSFQQLVDVAGFEQVVARSGHGRHHCG